MPTDDRFDGPEHDLFDETPPRSIFATMWFRALLVLIVLAVVVAVAVPYILDATNPPTKPTIASRPQPAPSPPPAAVMPPPPAFTTAASSALTTQADQVPDKPTQPDRAPADKPATATPAPSGRAATSDKPVARDKSTAADKTATIPKPAAAEKSPATEKPAATEKKETRTVAAATDVRTEAKSASPATKRVAARSTTAVSAPRATATSEWWVQVGAYRDENTARKVAARLREHNYTVEETVRASAADRSAPAASAPSPTGVDQYDVFVSGMSTAELSSRLSGKGLTAESSGSGAVVKPSLPLRDAVALSKDLATDGLKVQVRRAGSPTGETTIPADSKRPAPAATSGDPLYRVRVGGFADRATAVSMLKELESKGYKPFIARGGS